MNKDNKKSFGIQQRVFGYFLLALCLLGIGFYLFVRFYYDERLTPVGRHPHIYYFLLLQLCVTLFLLFRLRKEVIRPLEQLTNEVSAISETEDTKAMIGTNFTGAEFKMLAGTINQLLEQLGIRAQELKDSNDSMKIFENSVRAAKDGIVIFDPAGTIEFVNEAFNESLGYNEGEIVGQRLNVFELLFHMTPPDRVEEMMQTLKKGNAVSAEIKLLTKQGALSFDDITAAPIMDENGALFHTALIKRNVNEKKRHEEILEHLANHDALTLLPNRRKFVSVLNDAIAQCGENGKNITVFFLDLNDFKIINDTLGHSAGDRLLKLVSGKLSDVLADALCVARMGGDEFTVLIESKDTADLEKCVQKIFSIFNRAYTLRNRDFAVTASIGSATYPQDGDASETLLRNADTAMYQAKSEGKNSYQPYCWEFSKVITEKLELEDAIKKGLEESQFRIQFQPKMNTKTKRVFGCEALVRWQTASGLVSPAEFIPLADETGLIIPLTRWVLKEACRQNQILIEKGYESVISINVPYSFLQHKEFFPALDEAFEYSGMAPKYLDLEITEGTLIHDSVYIRKTLQSTMERQINISIDDFGTGYSSLSYLNKYPISRIKVDSTFVRGVPNSKECCAIVEAVVTICKGLHLATTAEGVETVEQMEFLEALGCDEIQGYYIGKPMDIDAYEKFMSNWNKIVEG